MKERPILFSAPMVRSILEGRKTQTRRVMKPQAVESFGIDYNADGSVKERRSYGWSWCKGTGWPHVDIFPGGESLFRQFCPYGAPGDRLWVRETWRPSLEHLSECTSQKDIRFAATVSEAEWATMRWRPSIHMPRWASRINLEVTGVRVERLLGISRNDSIAEGLSFVGDGGSCWGVPGFVSTWWGDPVRSYQALWTEINGAPSWFANPWVWVVAFKRVLPT